MLVAQHADMPTCMHAFQQLNVTRCLARQATKPTYRELETLLRATEGSNAGLTWVQRLQSEFAFNKKALDE